MMSKTVQTSVTEQQLSDAQGGQGDCGDEPVWVECPDGYDSSMITAEDILRDAAIRRLPRSGAPRPGLFRERVARLALGVL